MRLEAYERLVASLLGVERKGASMPYTSVNGNMFSFLDPLGHLSLRLPAEDRASIIEAGIASHSVQNGAVLKEYVEVPDSLWSDFDLLVDLMRRSHEYAVTLKAKPTRRKES